MAFVKNRAAIVTIGGSALAYKTDVSYDIVRDEDDTTNHDDGGWKSLEQGLGQLTGSMTFKHDDTDADQDGLLDNVANAEGSLAVVIQPEGAGTGKPQLTFNAIFTNAAISQPNEGVIEVSVNFKSTGAVTKADQA